MTLTYACGLAETNNIWCVCNQNNRTCDSAAAVATADDDDDWNDDDGDDNLQWSYESMIYELQDKRTLLTYIVASANVCVWICGSLCVRCRLWGGNIYSNSSWWEGHQSTKQYSPLFTSRQVTIMKQIKWKKPTLISERIIAIVAIMDWYWGRGDDFTVARFASGIRQSNNYQYISSVSIRIRIRLIDSYQPCTHFKRNAFCA